MNEEKLDFMILGRKIGTYTGWDQTDAFSILVYDFEPIEGVDLPAREDITFSFETGQASWWEDVPEGDLGENFDWSVHEHSVDFLPLIQHVPLENK